MLGEAGVQVVVMYIVYICCFLYVNAVTFKQRLYKLAESAMLKPEFNLW